MKVLNRLFVLIGCAALAAAFFVLPVSSLDLVDGTTTRTPFHLTISEDVQVSPGHHALIALDRTHGETRRLLIAAVGPANQDRLAHVRDAFERALSVDGNNRSVCESDFGRNFRPCHIVNLSVIGPKSASAILRTRMSALEAEAESAESNLASLRSTMKTQHLDYENETTLLAFEKRAKYEYELQAIHTQTKHYAEVKAAEAAAAERRTEADIHASEARTEALNTELHASALDQDGGSAFVHASGLKRFTLPRNTLGRLSPLDIFKFLRPGHWLTLDADLSRPTAQGTVESN